MQLQESEGRYLDKLNFTDILQHFREDLAVAAPRQVSNVKLGAFLR